MGYLPLQDPDLAVRVLDQGIERYSLRAFGSGGFLGASGEHHTDMYSLAADRVRFKGDEVAAVTAVGEDVARDPQRLAALSKSKRRIVWALKFLTRSYIGYVLDP